MDTWAEGFATFAVIVPIIAVLVTLLAVAFLIISVKSINKVKSKKQIKTKTKSNILTVSTAFFLLFLASFLVDQSIRGFVQFWLFIISIFTFIVLEIRGLFVKNKL